MSQLKLILYKPLLVNINDRRYSSISEYKNLIAEPTSINCLTLNIEAQLNSSNRIMDDAGTEPSAIQLKLDGNTVIELYNYISGLIQTGVIKPEQ